MPIARPRWERWLWVAPTLLVVLALALSSRLNLQWADYGARDLVAYWGVPRTLLWGREFYDFAFLQAIQEGVGYAGPPHEPYLLNHNPPPLLAMLLPLGGLPFTGAVLFWHGLSVALYTRAAQQLNRTLPRPLPDTVLLAVAFLFVPTFLVIAYGQAALLLVALVVFAWEAQRRGQPVAAGVLLVPVLLKFHLFLLVFLLFGLVALRQPGRERMAGAFLGVLLLLLLLATVLTPGWFFLWRDLAQAWEWISLSPWDVAQAKLRLPPWFQFVGVASIGLFALWRYYAARTISPKLLGEASLLSLLAAPFAYSFDAPILMPAALWIGSTLWHHRTLRFMLIPHTLLNLWLMPFEFNLFLYLSYLGIFVALWVINRRGSGFSDKAISYSAGSTP